MTPRITRSAIGLLASFALAGCAGGETSVPYEDDDVAPVRPTQVVHEFIAHMNAKARTLTFTRVQPSRASAPSLSPQSIDDLTVTEDGVAGSGPNNTVELITNSVGLDGECPAGFQTNTFCANVSLSHFYNRSLSNVFVQIVNVRLMDDSLAPDHGGMNSDGSELGLDNTYGLWKYTSPASNAPGVLGQSPFNSDARDWVFANPDNADTYVKIRVVASLSHAGYIMDYSSQPFVDACASGTSLGTASTTTQTLPFPFTLYNANNTTVRFNKRAVVTFGNVGGTSSGSNLNLPNGLAPKPGLFVFWDDIGYGSSGSAMCYQTLGAAPNRQYVMTWKAMSFVPAADKPSSLTFSAFLSEGTDQIDLVYDTMTGPNTRADGDSATVGVQDASGKTATAEYNTPDFGSGNAYSLVPIP
jgi:hypothetical protein